jgi:hypothetical protein
LMILHNTLADIRRVSLASPYKQCCTLPQPKTSLAKTLGAARMEQVVSESSQSASYGLRHEILSPMETLAQSVSTRTRLRHNSIKIIDPRQRNYHWLSCFRCRQK